MHSRPRKCSGQLDYPWELPSPSGTTLETGRLRLWQVRASWTASTVTLVDRRRNCRNRVEENRWSRHRQIGLHENYALAYIIYVLTILRHTIWILDLLHHLVVMYSYPVHVSNRLDVKEASQRSQTMCCWQVNKSVTDYDGPFVPK
jgi:hypothetical protein